MAEFLLEIGLEEVPARMIAGAQAELQRRVLGMLERERLLVAAGPGAEVSVRSFASPRRLAVLVGGVAERQADVSEDLTGPSAKVAYKDGAPTAAAVAFAKKAGVEVDALKTVTTAKGEYLAARVVKAGRKAAEVIAAELPKELLGIYWAKNMYWLSPTGPKASGGDPVLSPTGSKTSGGDPVREGRPVRFVRPVRWLLALLDQQVVPMSFAGKASGNITYGHRVLHGDAPVVVETPGEYGAALEAAFVLADVESRRHRIRKGLDRVCRGVDGARWREDHELVETVTQLTEWPSVLLGGFEAEYLGLPEEVLVTVMRDHQKYFAVEDTMGRLLPHFLTVLNTEVDTAGEGLIRHGNERVLRARFNDARFFWEFDQRAPLRERVGLLEKVTFQKDLGSYAAKSERVRAVAERLGETVRSRGSGLDLEALDEAAQLAKTDLTTELVKEFTELQGVVGGLYARAQGVSEGAAQAIYDQYRPEGMDDAIPRTTEGALLAIADKADTIAGMFGLGLEPTGSKDPFALRRAANGIVKILAESELPLRLGDVAGAVAGGDRELAARMLRFFAERVDFYLREARGQAYDVVKAVMDAGADDVRDVVARAAAVSEVRGAESAADFQAVSAAFKRMRNILEQADERRIAVPEGVDEGLLLEPEETALAERANDLAAEVERLRATRNYPEALRLIGTLRPQVDAFFDMVMVMAPEESVRANRLALLRSIVSGFSRIADFSQIVVVG